jgi:Holliday junction resolvasome RuvABC ATP-dependent DNA helicase subunit
MIDRSMTGGILMDVIRPTSQAAPVQSIPVQAEPMFTKPVIKRPQPTVLFPKAESLTREEKLFLSSASNPKSPFHKIVGNAAAVQECTSIVFKGLGRATHYVSDCNVAYTGPAGVGKTMFAKAMASSLSLPFIEASPDNIKTPDDLFHAMQAVFKQRMVQDAQGICSLEMIDLGGKKFCAPACTIFIDEFHRAKGLAQSLLTATDDTSRTMSGEFGIMNTQNVQWQIATTDIGLVFDAFQTRFLTIELMPYNRDEMARIVHVQNPDIPMESCRYLTRYYYLVTREVLKAAGRVRTAREMSGESWEQAIEQIRVRDGIDDFGLSRKRVAVLESLYSGKKSVANLASSIGVKIEELEGNILKPMQMIGNGFTPLIETTSGGRQLTKAGRDAWEMRLETVGA